MRTEEAVSLKVGSKEVGGTNPIRQISLLIKPTILHIFLPLVSKLIFTPLFLFKSVSPIFMKSSMTVPSHTGMIINYARFSRKKIGTGYLTF
jgi:hypothetical protein